MTHASFHSAVTKPDVAYFLAASRLLGPLRKVDISFAAGIVPRSADEVWGKMGNPTSEIYRAGGAA